MINRQWKGKKGGRLTITAGSLRKIDQHETAEISPAMFPVVAITVVRNRKIRTEPIRLQYSLSCPLGKKKPVVGQVRIGSHGEKLSVTPSLKLLSRATFG